MIIWVIGASLPWLESMEVLNMVHFLVDLFLKEDVTIIIIKLDSLLNIIQYVGSIILIDVVTPSMVIK